MDIVTLPLTPRGDRYVLTFTEYNSRITEAFALPNMLSKGISRILVDDIWFRFGTPQQLLSDLGANLVSSEISETCEVLEIERLLTTPYRPESNCLIEHSRHDM